MTKSRGNGSGRTSIHIALQGKGGVGKSLISAILSQYLSSRGQDVCGIDVDPVNQTFSEYQGLRVECLISSCILIRMRPSLITHISETGD
jgi:CO dehydrogenase nickel-insertion accessory protein CooC1